MKTRLFKCKRVLGYNCLAISSNLIFLRFLTSISPHAQHVMAFISHLQADWISNSWLDSFWRPVICVANLEHFSTLISFFTKGNPSMMKSSTLRQVLHLQWWSPSFVLKSKLKNHIQKLFSLRREMGNHNHNMVWYGTVFPQLLKTSHIYAIFTSLQSGLQWHSFTSK